jgi:hypothetical protein
VDVQIKSDEGDLLDNAIPHVVIVKDGNYIAANFDIDLDREVDLIAQIWDNLIHAPLAGICCRGLVALWPDDF